MRLDDGDSFWVDVDDGAFELAIDVSELDAASSREALKQMVPLAFDDEAPHEDDERGCRHLLVVPKELWMIDEPAPEMAADNAVFEVIGADGAVLHAHPMWLSRDLAGDETSLEIELQQAAAAGDEDDVEHAPPRSALPADFDARSFQSKLDDMWERCLESPNYVPRPTLVRTLKWSRKPKKKEYLAEGLASPQGEPFLKPFDLTQPRRKVVHHYGAVGRCVFEPVASAYSGLFSERCHGLIRCSSSLYQPKHFFIPGVSLKLPISGEHSRNLVALITLQGQGSDQRFFAGSPTTNVPQIARAPNTAWVLSLAALSRAEEDRATLARDARSCRAGQTAGMVAADSIRGSTSRRTPRRETERAAELTFYPTKDVQRQWANTGSGHFYDKLTRLRPTASSTWSSPGRSTAARRPSGASLSSRA